LHVMQSNWEQWGRDRVSPFESVCLSGCLESGLAAEEGGARANLLGVNMVGLGTVVDSLLAIRALVCDERLVSLAELREQVQDDFPDEALLSRCRGLPGKYGTDTEASNALAREMSEFLADTVLAGRLAHGVRPYPAFFAFSGDVNLQMPATPDGRRSGEYLSYGCAPSTLCHGAAPTSVLNAAGHVAHDRAACGSPLTLSLNRADARGADGAARLRQLVEAYFAQGGFHLHLNLLKADELRAAQRDPEAYPDLIVRISGFSANFHTIDRRWQDAIIERTERGM
jgi:pyruvate-formate lyase